MSKPNLLAFSTSIGFFRNKRVRDFRAFLAKKVQAQMPFCELAPQFFSILMAYAGENQIDGDFSDYSTEQYQEIFANNNRPLTAAQTKIVIDGLHDVGLMEDGKIRSWKKYNRHLACYEQDKKAKIKAGKERQKQRAAQTVNGQPLSGSNGHDAGLPGDLKALRAASSKPDAKKIDWNGKLYFPSELAAVIDQLEAQIEAKKKQRPDAGDGSHNICLTWVAEINQLEAQLASARSAYLGTVIKPKVHKLPCQTSVSVPDLPNAEQEEGRKKAAQRLAQLSASI